MTYREKTPTVVSLFVRKLKPGKTIKDFQEAHLPDGLSTKTEFGYDADYFGVPTRVINAVDTEDPSIVYSIGLSYGDIETIFHAVSKKSQTEAGRHDKLEDIVDQVRPPAIAFVANDNNTIR